MKKEIITAHLSAKSLRRRRFLLVLPLLTVPFLTLLFVALGGGKGSELNAQAQRPKGLNTSLPDANIKEEQLSKLSYYEKAAQEAARQQQLIKTDPYYLQDKLEDLHTYRDTMLLHEDGSRSHTPSLYSKDFSADINEEKVYKKLSELNTALNQSPIKADKTTSYPNVSPYQNTSISSRDLDRLEKMMDRSKNRDEDPEVEQLNAVMEKILDIQHPERVRQKMHSSAEKNKEGVFTVNPTKINKEYISLLENDDPVGYRDTLRQPQSPTNRFFSLEEETDSSLEPQNLIQAVVPQTQALMDGSVVMLRLTMDVWIKGTLMPKGTLVFGTASLKEKRLSITVSTVRYQNSLFPVQLSVYDLDGMQGISIPGALTRHEVAKHSTERAVQGLGMGSLSSSLPAQAVNAGIEAAKTLWSRKAKQQKITLPAGYQILLRNEQP